MKRETLLTVLFIKSHTTPCNNKITWIPFEYLRIMGIPLNGSRHKMSKLTYETKLNPKTKTHGKSMSLMVNILLWNIECNILGLLHPFDVK